MIVKYVQFNVVNKVWGQEHWIYNGEEYCGKKLILNRGFQCSMHHHKVKTETFYVAEGLVYLEREDEHFLLRPNTGAHIPVGTQHRFSGLKDSVIFEFSTRHYEYDSYRSSVSGPFDFAKMVAYLQALNEQKRLTMCVQFYRL